MFINVKIKLILFILIIFITISCSTSSKVIHKDTTDIDLLLNQWHTDVAKFRFDAYFDKMDVEAVFIGTDVTEVWNKEEFMAFSKPFFENKQTWEFIPLQRNIYFDASGKTAWFDEVLDTWMGLCRGSGVLCQTKEGWKIKQYVLSVTVPNDAIKKVIEAKKETEKQQISLFKKELK